MSFMLTLVITYYVISTVPYCARWLLYALLSFPTPNSSLSPSPISVLYHTSALTKSSLVAARISCLLIHCPLSPPEGQPVPTHWGLPGHQWSLVKGHHTVHSISSDKSLRRQCSSWKHLPLWHAPPLPVQGLTLLALPWWGFRNARSFIPFWGTHPLWIPFRLTLSQFA